MASLARPTAEVTRRELQTRVLAFVSRRVRSREDAEDIAQEVMLRIHRHSADLEHVDRMARGCTGSPPTRSPTTTAGRRDASCRPGRPPTSRSSSRASGARLAGAGARRRARGAGRHASRR